MSHVIKHLTALCDKCDTLLLYVIRYKLQLISTLTTTFSGEVPGSCDTMFSKFGHWFT